MTDPERLARRLAAVERALTGVSDPDEIARDGARIEEMESRLADLDDRVAELEATARALRGYVGNVSAVNEDVRRRADVALSKAEAAEKADAKRRSPGTFWAEDLPVDPTGTDGWRDAAGTGPEATGRTESLAAFADRSDEPDRPDESASDSPSWLDDPGRADESARTDGFERADSSGRTDETTPDGDETSGSVPDGEDVRAVVRRFREAL